MKLSQRALVFVLVSVFVGCGGKVIVSGQGGSSTSTETTTSTATTTTSACTEGPDCVNGYPSPGSPCEVIGTCCTYWQCDHEGGSYPVVSVCGADGTWEW